MGSGKSYWGQQLSHRLQYPFVDLDAYIETASGKTISQLFEEKGEEQFRHLEKDMLEHAIREHPSMVLSTGGGTPCFYNNIELMKHSGTVVWLNPPIEILMERLLRERDHRPLLRAIPETELRSFIGKKMNDRRLYYEQAQVHVNQASVTLDQMLQLIVHE